MHSQILSQIVQSLWFWANNSLELQFLPLLETNKTCLAVHFYFILISETFKFCPQKPRTFLWQYSLNLLSPPQTSLFSLRILPVVLFHMWCTDKAGLSVPLWLLPRNYLTSSFKVLRLKYHVIMPNYAKRFVVSYSGFPLLLEDINPWLTVSLLITTAFKPLMGFTSM